MMSKSGMIRNKNFIKDYEITLLNSILNSLSKTVILFRPTTTHQEAHFNLHRVLRIRISMRTNSTLKSALLR